MNTQPQFDREEILSVARQFNLTGQQTEIAAKFVAGESLPFALKNYPQEIRTFVAMMRERQTERRESHSSFLTIHRQHERNMT